MKHTKEFTKQLLEMAKVTRGRVGANEVFRDFVAYSALTMSILTDPVHQDRKEQLQKLLERYKENERAVFAQTLKQLTEVVVRNVDYGFYEELFAGAFNELRVSNRALKQDFTPPSLAKLVAGLVRQGHTALPESGYFTLSDPACGAGILLLSAAEQILIDGFNPSAQLVIQATDLDLLCVQMTYIQLSLYGLPAVVIHGNTLTLQEYDRWYTPAYILGKWIWRAPMPLGGGRNASDETLKMIDEPIYGACRKMEQLFSKERNEG